MESEGAGWELPSRLNSSLSGARSSGGKMSASKSRKSVAVNSNFIKAKTKGLDDIDGDWRHKLRLLATRIAGSNYFINFMAVVVLVDAVSTCVDIDARAVPGGRPSELANGVSDTCLALYTAELLFTLASQGLAFVRDWMVLIDLVVIVSGYAEMIIEATGAGDVLISLGFIRVLRLMRILRLTRLLRKTRALRELQKLVRMMATCVRALFWSFVFCFMIMTVWAMLLVEWVHPCVRDMYDQGFFRECGDQCLRSTQSVLDANLLLFKTVIAGDSWGEIAVPVIQEFPATSIIFCGSLLTLVFGVLNLIVAVIVDNFAEARQRDVLNLAEEMEDSLDKDAKFLEAIFQRIDEDGSGQVTFEELVEGARKDKEFQSRLRVMDIDEEDLLQLFEMIDTGEDGYIEPSQFIGPMTRWVHESKTAPRFIKYNMHRSVIMQEELLSIVDGLAQQVNSMATHLGLPQVVVEEDFMATSCRRFGPKRFGTHSPSPVQSRPLSPTGSPTITRSWNLSRMQRKTSKESTSGNRSPSLQEAEEEVEQPKASTPMTLGGEQADNPLKLAMANLESIVVDATSSALKVSLTAVEVALKERWRDGLRPQEEVNLAGIFDGTQLHRLIGQQILKQRRDEEHQSSGLGQSSGSGHEKELQQRRAHSMDSLKEATPARRYRRNSSAETANSVGIRRFANRLSTHSSDPSQQPRRAYGEFHPHGT